MNNVLNINDVQAKSHGLIWVFIAMFAWMNWENEHVNLWEVYVQSAVQRFPDWIFYRFPTNAIYRAAIELRSWTVSHKSANWR